MRGLCAGPGTTRGFWRVPGNRLLAHLDHKGDNRQLFPIPSGLARNISCRAHYMILPLIVCSHKMSLFRV